MTRALPLLFLAIVLSPGGAAVAQTMQIGGETVRIVSTRDIQEKIDGKDAAVTVVEVTIEPGKEGLPHTHPGPGFVCVVEGEYELGIDNQPTKRFKAGETFYEPTGCIHSVSRNPAKTGRTRLIAFVLHPRGVTEIAVPVDPNAAPHEMHNEHQQ
jgi:quercetin dioxygenase-like cupin family protein